MKRALLVIILFILVFSSSKAQDLIVTNKNDSIHCKITKVNDDYIYFTFKKEDDFRSSLMAFKEVKSYQKDYFSNPEVTEKQLIGYGKYPKFRIAIHGGYSHMLAKVSNELGSDFQSYVKDLKSGFHLGGDVSYYFNPVVGIGLKCHVFKSSNSMDDIYVEDDDGNRYYGIMSDKITTTFVGPTFSTRFLDKKKANAFIMSVGIGYLGYVNRGVFITELNIKGSTPGLTLDFAYDVAISEHSALGLQISLITGSLSKLEVSDGQRTETLTLEEGSYENISRIDLSVGFRFGK